MKLDGLPELDVSLIHGLRKLAEYDDGEDHMYGEGTASGYVEAQSGTHFAIQISAATSMAKSSSDQIEMRVFLDGKNATNRIYNIVADGIPTCVKTLEGVESNRDGYRMVENFMFAHLNTSDTPVGNVKKEDFKDMGTVTVKCIWCRDLGRAYIKDGDVRFESAIGASVPEKCLKGRAISNRASTGAPQYAGGNLIRSVPVDYPYGKVPFATFKFKYRSRRDLQIEGVIARSPSPVPLEDRDPDDLSPDEARELVRRLRAREQEQNRVKQEIKKEKGNKRARSITIGESDDDEVTVTSEGPSNKRNRLSNDSGIEMIDLTED